MKEKIEKCLEDRRRGAKEVVCWRVEAGAAEPGGRRRRLEELGNLQFANLEEIKTKSKVGNLLGRNKNKK